jgi:hypothetical protein
MSRLDFCQYELVDDCHDWKNDNCDECNIFKSYCEGARRAKNSIVRCMDCIWGKEWNDKQIFCDRILMRLRENDFCSYGERRK